MKNREELIEILRREYPKMWTKFGEQFNGSDGAIWTGEGSMTKEDYPLFDYNSDSSLYVMGTWKPLYDLLDKHGWYCEWYDSGTVLIYPND